MPCGALFPDEAAKGLAVFRSLKAVNVQHPDNLRDEYGGPVTPTVGEIAAPWMLELAEVVHGAYNAETGERLIREVFIKIPKKNWKSGFVAMLMLSLQVRNWRPANEAAVIAPTKEGADNVFGPMRNAIRADADLDALFHIQPIMRTAKHRTTEMTCRVYAADTDTVAGKIWAFVAFEELWLLSKRHGCADMMLEARGGQSSRPEGLVLSITTESDEEPVGVYKAKLEYARKVRDGVIDAPHFLPLLYEWPEDMLKSKAYAEPENFHLVNPGWGLSVDPVEFNREFEQDKEAGSAALRLFYAKRLNVPPSENVGGSWAGAEFWQQCGDSTLTFEELLKRSEVCTVGVDGGGLDDLLGLTVIGRERETGKWLWWSHAWAHPIVLQRRKDIASKLRDLEAVKDLTFVEKVGDDVVEVVSYVVRINDAGLLPEKEGIGLDSYGIGSILDGLEAADIPEGCAVAVSQGGKLHSAIQTVERALAGKKIIHAAQLLMAWCVGNAKVELKGNAAMITKAASGSAKIDPLMSGFNAVYLMSMNPEASGIGHSQGFVSL
jgi:phage terminase large subunit-like protein